MKWSLELLWPLLLLMRPDITGVASLSRKDLALVKPKSRILKNLGAVSETLVCCGYKAERMCLWEGRFTFLPGFQNMGQEIMLCTVRELVGGRVKKGELKSFERWSSEDPTLAVRSLVCNPSSLGTWARQQAWAAEGRGRQCLQALRE